MSERSIFLSALDIADGAERGSYLDRACGNDTALRRHVEELIAAEPKLGGFLAQPHAVVEATVDLAPVNERPGTIIGPYKLLQQIGEGGMGVVYMADQESPVRRRVALKIIKPGMDSRQVIARFEAERQALAMMDHQNIARVLDAGTTQSGRPYFVMELVHGVPLTKFCDDNRLTLRERLELFLPVCHAIQHAHQKGVIHRDIKPSNILVTMYDDKPVPKVIDFGVAKAIEQRLTEKTLFTQYGTLVGTVEYMSPEQAEMNAYGVDTRSDIYSLGVLLYELLTGTTPLERPKLRDAALVELVRLIKEEEPPRPSIRLSSTSTLPKFAAACRTEPARLSQLVRGELDWIVMKCLEKNRTRRYETAVGLARDVERFLKNEPVEACPPSAVYRLRKLAGKHRAALVTAGAFAAILVAATVVSTWQAVRATQAVTAESEQRHRAEESEQVATRERNVAAAANQQLQASLYPARISAIPGALESGSLGRVQDLLAQTRPAKGEADLRGFEWHYLQRQLHEGELSAVLSPEKVMKAVLSSSGNRAVGIMDGTPERVWMHVIETKSGDEVFQLTLAKGRQCLDFQFNHDGTRLAWVEVAKADVSAESSAQTAPVQLQVWDLTGRSRAPMFTAGDQGDLWSVPTQSPQVYLDQAGNRVALISHGSETESSGAKQACRMTVWEVPSGRVLLRQTLEPPTAFVGGNLSPDGTQVAAIVAENGEGSPRRLQMWNVTDRSLQIVQEVAGFEFQGLSFLPLQNRMLLRGTSSDGQGIVRVFDLATRNFRVPSREMQLDSPMRCAVSADGVWLAAVSPTSPRLRVYELESGKLVFERAAHAAGVADVAFGGDASRLVTVADFGEFKQWLVPSAQGPGPAPELKFPGVLDITVSADGKRLATRQKSSKEIVVLETASGKEISRLEIGSRLRDTAGPRICLSNDGSLLALLSDLPPRSTRIEPYAAVWDVASKQPRFELGPKELGGSLYFLHSLQPFSPDGTRLVLETVDKSGTTSAPRVLDTATGQQGPSLSLPPDCFVITYAFSPDGKSLAGVGGFAPESIKEAEGRVLIWDLETGELRQRLKHGKERFVSVAFQPGGSLLAAGSRSREIVIWDAATGRQVNSFHGLNGEPFDLAFSPDGHRLVSYTGRFSAFDGKFTIKNGQVELWDITTGHELLRLEVGEGVVNDLSFSANGQQLIAPVWHPRESFLKIWDATPLAVRHEAYDVVARWMDKNPNVSWNKTEVLHRIAEDQTLTDELRRGVLQIAESWPVTSGSLNEESWQVVGHGGKSLDAYSQALRNAERAEGMAPTSGAMINTLGVAQYRAGRFAEAKETLLRSKELQGEDEEVIADLAFLALVCHSLGQRAEAIAYLQSLRQRCKQFPEGIRRDFREIVSEAESVLQSPP